MQSFESLVQEIEGAASPEELRELFLFRERAALSSRVIQGRVQKGWSQEELARRSGAPVENIIDLERYGCGDARNVLSALT